VKSFITIGLLFYAFSVFSQNAKENTLTYKGGHPAFTKFINKRLMYDSATESPKRNFSLLASFNIDSNNQIKNICIFSLIDSTYSNIEDLIRKTAGNWINQTGKDQMVLIRLNYRYIVDENRRPLITDSLSMNAYENGQIRKPAFFETIDTGSYPPVR
jgi:hypothetical protein